MRIFDYKGFEILDFMFVSFFNGIAIGLAIALLIVSNRYFPNFYLLIGGLLILFCLLFYQFNLLKYLAFKILNKDKKEDDKDDKGINNIGDDDIGITPE